MVADPQRSRKSKRSLRSRWLDFCEDTDHYLNKGKRHTTHAQGIALLISAVFRWMRSKLGLDWVRTWWLKRASDRARRKAQNVEARGFAKFTETLEKTATTIGYNLSSVWSWIYKLVVPEKLIKSTEKTVASASSGISKTIYGLIVGITQRIFPKWLRQRFRFVGRAFETCYFFCTAWSKSRDLMKLAWSLPAALLAVPLLLALVWSAIYSPADKIQHYQRSLAEAIDSRNEPNEQLCVTKLSQLGYNKLERAEYYAAFKLGEEGKWEEAAERMLGIAPTETAGYAAAHFWLAHHWMNGNLEAPNRLELVETHARHAQQNSTSRQTDLLDAAKRLLVECEFRKGNTDEAMENLASLSTTKNDLYFEMLERYLIIGDTEKARSYADNVDDICKQKIKDAKKRDTSPEADDTTNSSLDDNPPPLAAVQYGTWAKASGLLGQDPNRTIAILNDGLAANPGHRVLTRLLGQILRSEIDRHPLEAPETLDLLTRLFRLEPRDPTGAAKLAQGIGKNEPRVQQILKHLENQDALSDKLCMKLGTAVWNQTQDAPKTIHYYEWAVKLDPEFGAAWNNVAWMRGCVEETRNLPVALAAADRAIELNPSAACYETRGQIYVLLERWEDAVRDLQIALNGSLPDSRPAHLSLATALEALGKNSTAEAHRRLANGT